MARPKNIQDFLPGEKDANRGVGQFMLKMFASDRLSPADMLAREKERASIAAAEASLAEYAKQAWPLVEPTTPFVPGWHIDVICRHLEAVTRGELRNLIINMPPRHMKSYLVSVFWPTWEWIAFPSRRWLFSSYSAGLSMRDSLRCRRIIESPWYQERWGHLYQLTGDQNVKMRFENNRTGYRLATSVGGAATGEGGGRIVVDDPHNVKDAPSETIRQAALDWWDQVMSTRGDDPKTVAKIVVAQRVHTDDLSGHLLAQGGYEHLNLRARYEDGDYVNSLGLYDLRSKPGELLWPDRFGEHELVDLERGLGAYGVAGQLQQHPSPAVGGIFKRGWWQWYKEPPGHFDEIIQSWDMTFKDLKHSDYVVGQVWGRLGADKYLLAQTRDRLDFPATVQAVRILTAQWPESSAKLVEDKANGTAVIATLRHQIPGIIAVEPEGSKEARAHAVSAQVEAGNVYLPDPERAPWIADFVEEHAAFPMGANDDQVDATTQALRRLAETSTGWRLL